MSTELAETPEVGSDAVYENVGPSTRAMAVPYMSGTTFTNSFEKYATNGLPDVFDISYFGGMSGSTIAQIRGTLKFFDLIDDSYAPTEMLRDLVEADEETRKDMLKLMVEEKFPDVLALSMNATSGQLAKVFNERGINGATVDKAIAFYLHMLDFVGIPYSSHFKKRRPSSGSTGRRRKPPAPKVEPPLAPHHAVKPKLATEEEQKAAYIQTLLELAKKDGTEADTQDKIFDRIEKALGIGIPNAATDGST